MVVPATRSLGSVVQTILLAHELHDQFRREAAITNRAGAWGDESGASNHLANAERIYVAVWEHLDDAAAGLRALGRDVAAYRRLRAEVGGGSAVGVLDIERVSHHVRVGGAGANVVTSQATFNAEGARLAGEALAVLKAAVAEVDWEAATRPPAAPAKRLRIADLLWIGFALAAVVALIVVTR